MCSLLLNDVTFSLRIYCLGLVSSILFRIDRGARVKGKLSLGLYDLRWKVLGTVMCNLLLLFLTGSFVYSI